MEKCAQIFSVAPGERMQSEADKSNISKAKYPEH